MIWKWKGTHGLLVRVVGRRRMLAIKQAIQPPRAKDVIDIEWLRDNQP
jgi:hypothetical protein